MKKYYYAILILAVLTVLSVADFQQSERIIGKTSAPQNLRNEKAIEFLKETGGYDSISEAFAVARYKIEQNGDTLSAQNPANQMQMQFAENGNLQLSGTNWQTAWQLKSIGRGDFQTEIGSGNLQSNGNRTELQRTEIGLTEYFENRPDGLEQGFILNEKPSGEENLRLILQTRGELKPMASADGQTINLFDESGAEVLRYEKLKVWDAENKDLTARMTTNNTGEIALEVEDANAVYPLTIDPIFVQHQKLLAADGAAEDSFGTSVAIAGDTVVIGAYQDNIASNVDQGSAYIFVRNGTNWIQQAKLTANDGAGGDNFGIRVAISGDTVIVGSSGSDIGANTDQGAAYVFVRSGTTWSAQAKLVAGDAAEGDKFGFGAAVSGDTVVVGALYDNITFNADQGSAYIFVRNGANWTQQAKLTADDGAGGDIFGSSVGISGGSVIVAATRDSVGSNTNQGSAYIFTRNGTSWTQQTKLTANDGTTNDYFGSDVDITNTVSGTIAVVGARLKGGAGNLGQGAAYIFTRSLIGMWSQTQKLTASDGGANEGFGVGVSITPTTGNAIIVGAWFVGNGGTAYVFKRDGTVWTQRQKLLANDRASGDTFGNSTAISGDTAIVGALNDSVGSNNNQGSTYIFNLAASPFDFDGDDKTDISIFRPAPGEWWINRSSNNSTFAAQFGLSTDKITPADFTGDGKTDIAFFRPSSGQWFVLRSEDSSFYAFPFGANGDTPAPADYDGDGKTDAAVFRASTLTWYISKSSGGTDIIGFGAAGDKPVIGDYDGDGRADIAIFRNGANGAEWWIRRSSNATVFATQFGLSTDNPTQGDFTGDGKADIAFFRPSNGNWFVLRSEDFSFYSFPFGTNGDIPVAGDYDGDGKFDAGVFRPTNTTWYLNRSTAGTLIQQFGQTGDKPLPNSFVP